MKKWIILVLVAVLVPASYIGYKQLTKPDTKKTSSAVKSNPPTPAPAPQPEPKLDTSEMHNLINQERKKAGIRALNYEDRLYDSAMAKCEDMKKKNYFTHDAPDGTKYTSFIQKSVPQARVTSENLGAGYADNASLVNEWMASPQHKENIVSTKFNNIGIAVCGKASEKPGLIIVAHFAQL